MTPLLYLCCCLPPAPTPGDVEHSMIVQRCNRIIDNRWDRNVRGWVIGDGCRTWCVSEDVFWGVGHGFAGTTSSVEVFGTLSVRHSDNPGLRVRFDVTRWGQVRRVK